jgi:hypothetical protein
MVDTWPVSEYVVPDTIKFDCAKAAGTPATPVTDNAAKTCMCFTCALPRREFTTTVFARGLCEIFQSS